MIIDRDEIWEDNGCEGNICMISHILPEELLKTYQTLGECHRNIARTIDQNMPNARETFA